MVVVPIGVLVWVIVVPLVDAVASALGAVTSRFSTKKPAGAGLPDATGETFDVPASGDTRDKIAARRASGSARRAS